ncbi:ubiquinone biosynthesis accessory factor UbiJ [Pseudoalteromonas denitrificans]|jgi:ubiquinone biosynthesis protein UbiJ|uniref:Ubiquinone biosynthesis accessory factor UbiJ n=1 Tax=Pseudoalteromonas denitrificans DSM 6059 TaxID=1123010 RepID=A0A1I1MJX9_9GAMM|nr:SCP2 sterol-binding domain-containing protein [Pseudoalteromonas denitrificans]SFC83448.1 ubiquinone biosynthesis protein UbiJ [Pseudoalteromonas denitrificans DSM 6059]
MLSQLIITLIESILNQAIKLSPQLRQELKKVQHKKFQLNIRNWKQNFVILYTGEKCIILTTDENNADCIICASIETLLELKDPAKITKLIRENQLDLEGDLQLAQTYSSAFSKIDIDWPEQLSQYVGDGMSYKITKSIKSLFIQQKKITHKITTTAQYTLQDELNIAMHPIELTIFKKDNRQLSGDVDVLEHRINMIMQQVAIN